MCSENVLCPLCFHSSFKNVASLLISLIKTANTPILCPQCNEFFLGLDKLTIHLFSHSKFISDSHSVEAVNCNVPSTKASPQCDICGRVFRSEEVLKMHCKLKHRNVSNTNSNGEHAIENQNQSKQIDNECVTTTNCTKNATVTNVNLKCNAEVELRTLTADDILNIKPPVSRSTQKQNSPNIPPADLNPSVELITSTIDIKLAESPKAWECDICTKAFTTKYFLKKHKRLHTGEMPYSCEICGRAFTFQQSYHKHLLYHSDDKPHVCQICHRAFKELSTLHNHERIHSGEKPFKCEICGKCFRQRVSFLVHTRIHTGVMPYKCSECQKSFRYKLSLRTHKCLPSVAESEKNTIQPLFGSNPAMTPTVGELNDLPDTEKNVPGTEIACHMPENYFTKPMGEITSESCSNMEIGTDLQNFNEIVFNAESNLPESTHCPSIEFQNLHLYPPLVNKSTIDDTEEIGDTFFPQFLYDIGSGYL